MWLFSKNLIFTLLVPGAIAVYIPLYIALARGQLLAFKPVWLPILALLSILAGSAIYLWCLWDFAVLGRGTPAPIDSPKWLVVRGPYRYVRNPMYLGVLLVIAGWAVWFQSWPIVRHGAVVALLVHMFIVLVEEPSLHKRFGADYDRYCKAAGRWIPRGRPA
jgi:protein-S-isoprenylcysteine O-methyltransferase Ste14